jgi:hypothetical protein
MFTRNQAIAKIILVAVLLAGTLGVQPAQAGMELGSVVAPLSSTIGNWSALGSNPAGTDGALSHPFLAEVDVIAVSGTDVYVGGCFIDAGGDPTADYIAKWDGTNWSGLGNDGLATPNGALKACVRAIAVSRADVYVGGYPDVWNSGAPVPNAEYFAKWDGTNWSGLGGDGAGGSSLNNQVTSIAIYGNDVYVGGYFTDVKNGSIILNEADYVAKWDGANWSALGNNGAGNGSLDGWVEAILMGYTLAAYLRLFTMAWIWSLKQLTLPIGMAQPGRHWVVMAQPLAVQLTVLSWVWQMIAQIFM